MNKFHSIIYIEINKTKRICLRLCAAVYKPTVKLNSSEIRMIFEHGQSGARQVKFNFNDHCVPRNTNHV